VHESLAAGATHGYRVAFGTLAVLSVGGAILTATMRVRHSEHEVVEPAGELLAEAA
jgi:hypothetical protein